MASWDDVRRIALALPEATERVRRDGLSFWEIRDRGFVWQRPLRSGDLAALQSRGEPVPGGDVLGVRVEHLGVKEVLLSEDPAVFFTTPHFDGYAAVLVRLGEIGLEELGEVIAEAWLSRAPKRLGRTYLERLVRREFDQPVIG